VGQVDHERPGSEEPVEPLQVIRQGGPIATGVPAPEVGFDEGGQDTRVAVGRELGPDPLEPRLPAAPPAVLKGSCRSRGRPVGFS
jgi:hypothetical protein